MSETTTSAREESHVPALSASSMNDFRRCPLKYRLSYVDKLSTPGSPATLRGTLVHKVLEDMFDLAPSQRTEAQVCSTIDAAWERVCTSQDVAPILLQVSPQELKDQARKLLHAYFTLENPQQLAPTGRESKFEAVLDNGIRLRGYIDRIETNPQGQVRIVDYKTGKAPQPRYQSDYLFQMNTYALLHQSVTGTLPVVTRLLFLGGTQPQHLDFTPQSTQIQDFATEIAQIWEQISRRLQNAHFEARRNALCNWCDFQDICPLFGDALPPLPPLRVEYMQQIGPAAVAPTA